MWRHLWFLLPLLLAIATPIIPIQPASAAHSVGDGLLEPENICNQCYCNHNTVICDFNHNHTLSSIWNNTYMVPVSVTAMEIQLKDRTQLRLHGGLFKNNRVNRFVVKGVNGNDQVELTNFAFRGNHGGLPDIQIIGVNNVFIGENAFSGGEIMLSVENSDLLVLFPYAFTNMNMSCNFTNINSLQIKEKAFNPSTDRSAKAYVKLYIANSHLDRIESFDVSMNKIRFVNCSINIIQMSAFDVIKINELSFEKCRIDRIEKGAFTGKLHSEHISITGTTINTIDKDAIMGSGISQLTLSHNTIHTIKEEAIQVHSVNVYIENNEITHQGTNWLHVMNSELITIKDNRFRNFAAIQLDQSNGRSNCTFANNYVGQPQLGSLNFTNCEIRAIELERNCNCDDSNMKWLTKLTEHDLSSELYCQLSKRLHNCFNSRTVHLRRFIHEACGANRTTIRCTNGTTLMSYDGEYITKTEYEEKQKGISLFKILAYIGAGILILTVLSFLLCMVIIKCRRKPTQVVYCQLPNETCATLIQEKSKMQNDVNDYIDKLTSGNLTKKQCYEIIKQVLDNYQLSSESNMALYTHLHQIHNNHNCFQDDDHQNELPSAPNQVEHIYDVPLLNNEYSDPNDHVTMSVYSEPINTDSDVPPPAYELRAPHYAKAQMRPTQSPPQSQSQSHEMPSTSFVQEQYYEQSNNQSPYYATPIFHSNSNVSSNQAATASTAAATVAPPPPAAAAAGPSKSATGTGQRRVRDLRQDLEAKPQFHPNQLSSPQNQLHNRFASNPRRTQCGNSNTNNSHNNNNNNNIKNSFECLDGAASLAAMEHMDMRGAAALPPDSGSDHSGGSDETVKIDDVIEYADA